MLEYDTGGIQIVTVLRREREICIGRSGGPNIERSVDNWYISRFANSVANGAAFDVYCMLSRTGSQAVVSRFCTRQQYNSIRSSETERAISVIARRDADGRVVYSDCGRGDQTSPALSIDALTTVSGKMFAGRLP